MPITAKISFDNSLYKVSAIGSPRALNFQPVELGNFAYFEL